MEEKEVENGCLMIDVDLCQDNEKSKKFWSISKVLRTQDGYHQATYRCRGGALRTPQESKKWKELIRAFVLVKNSVNSAVAKESSNPRVVEQEQLGRKSR